MHDHARNLAEMEIEEEGDEEQQQRRQMDIEGREDEHEQLHHGGQMDFEGAEDDRVQMDFEGAEDEGNHNMDFEGAEDEDLQQRRREATERILKTLSEGVSKKLTSMASGVTGSPQYWGQIRKNLKGKKELTRTLYSISSFTYSLFLFLLKNALQDWLSICSTSTTKCHCTSIQEVWLSGIGV